MSDPEDSEISRLLQAWNVGDTSARDRLIPLVYDDLREIARRHFQREAPGHTLQPTALVHELYGRLKNQRRVQWRNRKEFFAVSANMIRRILVDYARKRRAAKRGDGGPKISFDEALGVGVEEPNLLALDDALKDLEKIDPRGSQVVELHAFGGLSFDEIAEVLGVARSTTLRDWKHARLWLRRHLRDG
jgi:RNA polymerase sigma factor (TIGR02999 family)